MRNFKNLLYFLFLSVFVIMFSSCGDDDDSGPEYEFIDQNLQGKIEGVDFNFGDGEVEFDTDEMSLDLYSDMESSPACELFIGEFSRVFFSLPMEEGLTELSFNFSDGGQTVTLYEPPGNNIISSEGAIEITSITSSSVTGRIDARFDEENFVNGKFTITTCE